MFHRITVSLLIGLALAAANPAVSYGQLPISDPPVILLGDANIQGVAAIVNDRVISEYDVDQRLGLFVVTSGIVNPSAETLAQIREQVIRALEDETLQLQEAERVNIMVQPEEVDEAIESVALENGLTMEQIEASLTQSGVKIRTLRNQLAAGIAWSKLVQARYAGSVIITEEQIDTALTRLEDGADRAQFLVSEIFLSVDQPEDEEDVRVVAAQIFQQLNFGAVFPQVARQFSQSPSAAGGGDIGWVQQGQLPEMIDAALTQMQPGELAGPIRSEGGYFIVMLLDRREPIGTQAPVVEVLDINGPLPLDRLLVQAPLGIPDEFRQEAFAFAQTLRTQIRGCEDLPQISGQIEGLVHMRLGTMRLTDLSQALADAIRNTEPGGVTQPVFSDAGVELIVRCDPAIRRVIPVQIPTRDELTQQLFVQQLTVLARSYLRDLRRDAVVEIR